MSVQWESNQPPIDDQKPPPQPSTFIAHERVVMRGAEKIAVAKSNNFARRIARALNIYRPNEKGV